MKTPTINSRILKLEVLKDTATRASVNAVESRTTSLESDVATAQGDISTLQTDVSAAQGDISTLQGNVTTLTQGIADAVSTHNDATDSHADLRTLIDGKQAAGSYLTTTGTAADSAKLGGVAASGYSQTSHTHNYAGSSTSGGAATTALACTGNAATATTAASCTGNSATATTAGSCSGNAATATKLATPRTLTIGSKANTFDGSAGKAWTLAEIGAASTTALTTEATTRATNDNALWAALYSEQTGGTTCEIPLAATGDGSGVFTIRLWSDVANTATLSNGAFYGEIGGTTNLGQSVAMTAGQYTTFYIKLPASATATLTITYGWALTKWGQNGTECIVEATNAPKPNGFDVKYIPQNVTAIRIYSNLEASIVTGSTRAWTSATYIFFSGNSITLSGTTYPWTSAIQILFSGSSMTLSGTTYPWTSATYIYFSGDSMTISGTTYPWTAATTIRLGGNSMTLSGTTYPWTSAVYIFFSGNSMTLSGTTYPWTSATYIRLGGNSMTLSGTTYPWTAAATIRLEGSSMTISANLSTSCTTTGNLSMYLSGTSVAVTYPTTRTWPTTMRQVYLRPSVGSMPTADTDRLFIDVDATCTTASTEKVLDARGNCGAVTAASSAARTSLVAKGFAVSYNS